MRYINPNVFKLLLVIMVFSFIAPEKVFAYLDPGTGSMIVQVIIASLAGAGCALVAWKDKFLNLFKKGSKDD